MDLSGIEQDKKPLSDEDQVENNKACGKFRWVRLIFAIFVFIIIIVAFGPGIASLGVVRKAILGSINEKIAPAALDIESWRLRWFRPLTFSQINSTLPEENIDAFIEKIEVKGGLWRLLPLHRKIVFDVHLLHPKLKKNFLVSDATEKITSKKEKSKKDGVVVLPRDFMVNFQIEDGQIEIAGINNEQMLINNINVAVQSDSLNDPINVRSECYLPSGTNKGFISFEGVLPSFHNLLDGEICLPENIFCKVDTLDLALLRPLLNSYTGEPWIKSGIADGNWKFSINSDKTAIITTDFKVKQLSISLPARPDTPAADLIINTDLIFGKNEVKIKSLNIVTPWVGAAAQGDLNVPKGFALRDVHPSGSVQAKADINLAALVRDFAPILNLSDQMKVDQGRAELDATVNASENELGVNFALVTSGLKVIYNGEIANIVPAPSIKFSFNKKKNSNFEVDDLKIDLPCASVSGKGSVNTGVLQGRVDLTTFSRDYRKFFKSSPPMVGVLDFTGATTSDGSSVKLSATAKINDFAAEFSEPNSDGNLHSKRRVIIQACKFDYEAWMPEFNSFSIPELSNAVWRISLDGTSGDGSFEKMVLPIKGHKLKIAGGKLNFTSDLAAFSKNFCNLLPLPPTATIAGKTIGHVTLEMSDRQLRARINSAARPLSLGTTNWNIQEPDFQVSSAVLIDFANKLFEISESKITSSPAQVEIPLLKLKLADDGGNPHLLLNGNAFGSVDLTKLSAWQRPVAVADPLSVKQTRVDGKINFDFKASADKNGSQLEGNAVVSEPIIKLPNGVILTDEKSLKVVFSAMLAANGDVLTLNKIAVTSSAGELLFSGKIESLRKDIDSLLKGTIALDNTYIATILQKQQWVKGLNMKGCEARPFELKAGFGNGLPALMSYGQIKGAVHIGDVAWLGLTAKPADMKFNMDKGIATMIYEPSMQNGAIHLLPTIQTSVTPMMLEFKRDTKLFENVPLTQELADELLGRVNPLLRRCTVLGGRLDLTVKHCLLPLDSSIKNSGSADLQITLRDAHFMPTGVLADLIELAGMEVREFSFDRYTINAEIKDGRIFPQPITITINKLPIICSGTIGLDGTIACNADVPLSQGLVGRDAWKYLQGERVKVPITGTLDRVRLDSSAMQSEIARLVRRAVERAAVEQLGGLFDKLRDDLDSDKRREHKK